jgi:hypothetical protein
VVEDLSMLRGKQQENRRAQARRFFFLAGGGLLHLKPLQPCEKVSFFTLAAVIAV